MIYSKAKPKDHKRPPPRKSKPKYKYSVGETVLFNGYLGLMVDRIVLVSHGSYDLASQYYVREERIIGKISPKNKLLRLLVNV